MLPTIGVSNFPPDLLKRAIALSRHPIVTNQVEYHPALDQSLVFEVVRANGMILTAHTPLGMGQGLGQQLIHEIAADYGATPAQVILRWLVQQGDVVAIPRKHNHNRLAENLGSLALTLSDDDMRRISDLRRPDGRVVDPPLAPDWDS